MRVTLRSAWLLLCLWAIPLFLCAQDQAPATPATPVPPATAPSATAPTSPGAPPPPRYTPSTVNTGSGLSIEPMYWLSRGSPVLRRGDDNNASATTVADFDYPGKMYNAPGGTIIVPAGKNNSVQVSYFQTKINGGAIAGQDLNLYGVPITSGDPLGSELKLTNYKASYNFLTYYWNHKGGDVRLKTLWEFQYLSLNSTIDDFVLQTDGTFNVNPTGASKSIYLPTFGLGFDGTVSPHFRWEVKGSGFGLPHRSILGDAEADVALRYGRIELVAGGRVYHYRTTRRSDQYESGTIYGPYVGLRLYWKKR